MRLKISYKHTYIFKIYIFKFMYWRLNSTPSAYVRSMNTELTIFFSHVCIKADTAFYLSRSPIIQLDELGVKYTYTLEFFFFALFLGLFFHV